jgi:hypothetical protein
MSDIGPAEYAAYTSPPPPARPRSPWLYVGLGCGLTLLLLFGGCIAVVSLGVSRLKAEQRRPIDPTEISRSLGNTPRYPGAQVDLVASRTVRIFVPLYKAVFTADSGGGGAFRTADPFLKVLTFYDGQLQHAGFTPGNNQGTLYFFHRADEVIGLQHMAEKRADGSTLFLLVRFDGAKRPAAGH